MDNAIYYSKSLHLGGGLLSSKKCTIASLFDENPMEISKKKRKGSKRQLPVVLSASRMTDLPKYYPEELIAEVENRIKKGMQIHTIVLWTKHPQALLKTPLYSYLIQMKEQGVQLFLNCTITGLGKKVVGKCTGGEDLILEPNAPDVKEAIASLTRVIHLLGKPERIRLRIDPIVRIEDAVGDQFSNLKAMPLIIEKLHILGIKNYCFSFLEKGGHQKVDRRFQRLGVKILSPTEEERQRTAIWVKELEARFLVKIHSCCVPGFPETRCIDGQLLQELHDEHWEVDLSEPRSREKCGCTKSVDIGGWPPKKCYTGCQYCYANSSY